MRPEKVSQPAVSKLGVFIPSFFRRIFAATLLVGTAGGCAFSSPYVGRGPHPQITRGAPIPPIDFIGSVLSLPAKLILWNWNFNSHAISADTESKLTDFLDARNRPSFEKSAYKLNQYDPIGDIRALVKNRHMGWPIRAFPGFLVTVITDVLLPGRIMPWGDYFNPYTNVVHLYSDDASIALHEAGHAYDFADFPYKGTYALLRLVPFMDLYQEQRATDEAIRYLVEVKDRDEEIHAYKTLWPAYGTYIGGYFPAPLGSVIGAVVGHAAGRGKAKARAQYYEHMDRILSTPDRTIQSIAHPSESPQVSQ